MRVRSRQGRQRKHSTWGSRGTYPPAGLVSDLEGRKPIGRMSPAHIRRTALLLLVLPVVSLGCGTDPHPGVLSFNGGFESGSLSAWTHHDGGVQCANYGVASNRSHRRGTVYVVRTPVDGLKDVARFDLPSTDPPHFATSVCELLHRVPLLLGTDVYYGYMFYVPKHWSAETRAFWGVETAQFHFENIWCSPISFQLHATHMTLALETGACRTFRTRRPGCTWRSNADVASGPDLPPYYVAPPGMQRGVWHEVIMHVHWAADDSGQIDVWTRLRGDSAWSQTVHFRGHPTVQWSRAAGCCLAAAVDKVGAYRGASTVPVSVWLANITSGTTFAAVAATMH